MDLPSLNDEKIPYLITVVKNYFTVIASKINSSECCLLNFFIFVDNWKKILWISLWKKSQKFGQSIEFDFFVCYKQIEKSQPTRLQKKFTWLSQGDYVDLLEIVKTLPKLFFTANENTF